MSRSVRFLRFVVVHPTTFPFLIHSILFFRHLSPTIGFGDAPAYISQAIAIVSGNIDQYLKDSINILEHSRLLGPIAYPWGFSLLLAPVLYIKGFDPISFKIINYFLSLIASICLGELFRRRFGKLGFLPMLVILTNGNLLQFENQVYSDHASMSVSIICLIFYLFLVHLDSKYRLPLDFYLSFVVITALIPPLFRSNGMITSFAILGAEIYRSFFSLSDAISKIKMYGFSVFKAIVLGVSLGTIWSRLLPYGGRLAAHRPFPLSLANIYNGLTYYGSQTNSFWQLSAPSYSGILTLLTLLMASFGMWIRRKKEMSLILFFWGTLLLYLSLDMRAGFRYLICITPILLYFCFVFLFICGGKLSKPYKKLYWSLLSLVLIYGAACWTISGWTLREDSSLQSWHSNSREAREMYAFITRNASPNQTISFYKPRAIYLYSNLIAYSSDDPKTNEAADFKIVINQPEFFQGHEKNYRLEFQNSRFRIYTSQLNPPLP